MKAASEGFGLQSLAEDLGWSFDVEFHVDSSAAKSMASRKGVGKVRHLAVRFLWLQQAVREGRLSIRKVLGTLNSSDVLTKPKILCDLVRLLERLGCALVSNRGEVRAIN